MLRNGVLEGLMFRLPRVDGYIVVWTCRGNGCGWAMLLSSSSLCPASIYALIFIPFNKLKKAIS